MSLCRYRQGKPRAGFPRVSGDEPKELMHNYAFEWFSPRERG